MLLLLNIQTSRRLAENGSPYKYLHLYYYDDDDDYYSVYIGFWLCLAFESSTDPVDTSAQAALAPPPTMEQEESFDTTFMVM
jgi:hypothetical protein